MSELAELPGSVANAIAVVSVLVAGGGALSYLVKRPHLMGEQKLVALMIGLAFGVPLGGMLFVAVAAAIFLPACLSGCHFESYGAPWIVIAPLAIGTGVGVMVSASVADGRARRAEESDEG